MDEATKSFRVEHVEVRTASPFAEVVRRLEDEIGSFDPARLKAQIEAGAPAAAVLDSIAAMAGRSGFMRLAAFDFSTVLRLHGQPTQATRLMIGHPLIAARMAMRNIGSALYAPLSLLVAADGAGGTRLEYDRPSTLLAQFQDDGVVQVGSELDEKLSALIRSVAR